jgi:hypothetical protein
MDPHVVGRQRQVLVQQRWVGAAQLCTHLTHHPDAAERERAKEAISGGRVRLAV